MANKDAESFVTSYYETLQNNPKNVHTFFSDDSTMVRIDGKSTVSAKTVPKIMELLGSLGDVIFEIKTRNYIGYRSGGFVVTVSGLVHTNDFREQKKFFETFILAFRQNQYVIQTDTFDCTEEKRVVQSPEAMFHASSQDELEVAPQRAALASLLREPPTMDVASSDGASSVNSEGLEVAQENVDLSSPLREPPTMDVASSDGASSVNSGEDTKLHIGNLPKGYDNAEVAELVREVASPVLVQVGHAKKKQRKGYAFVTMETVEERDLVIARLNGKKCGGGVLTASVALNHNPKDKRQRPKAR